MKIMAEAERVGTTRHFILSATEDELSRLTGFAYTTSDGYRHPSVGEEINVSEMFAFMDTLRKIDGTTENLRDSLRKAADKLELPPAITAAIEHLNGPKEGSKG